MLVILSSPLLAETQYIKGFHDEEHAFVMNSDGSFVRVSELGLLAELKKKESPGIEIIGQEGGQYLFMGSDGEQYRAYVPEVITGQSIEPVVYCDQSPAVFSDDYRIASARGVEGECE